MESISVPVPMVTRVRLRNFRSIADCDVALGPLTILVGPNGSGKSNFLQALDFLADAVSNGLESAARRRGGMDSLMSRWVRENTDECLSIEIDLHLEWGRRATYYLALNSSDLGGFKIIEERCTVDPNKSCGSVESFVVNESKQEWRNTRGYTAPPPGSQERVKEVRSGVLTLPYFADQVYFGPVYKAIRGFSAYTFNLTEMRRPQEADGGKRLKPDGSNVASVYDRMVERNEHGTAPSERLVEWMRTIAPNLTAIRSVKVAGYMALQFEQQTADAESWIFNAAEMSYGTLRTFGVFVALAQGQMRDVSPVTLVGIEEPESTVHPGAATAILEAMTEASQTTQVLATTHSIALLDYDNLDIGVLRAVELHNGRTVIGPVDEASRRMLEEHLASAGELLRMRLLSPENGHDDSARTGEVAAPA